LTERADELVEHYSGGMRRRVNIAAGLVHEPAVLVLDEPTVGVDPQSRNAIMEGIEALRRDGLTVLYISHYMEEVERLCDRVGIIDGGRLIAEGTPQQLIGRLGEADHVLLSTDGDPSVLAARVRRLAGVQETLVEDGRLRVVAHAGRRLLPGLLAAAAGEGGQVTSAEVIEPDLEAVFLHLTGKTLRD
jgi:ABC-2 type transport system ATP-binding protein